MSEVILVFCNTSDGFFFIQINLVSICYRVSPRSESESESWF